MHLLGLLVLVAGFLVVWGGFTQPDAPYAEVCPEFDAEYGVTFDPQWWPPGTLECVATDIEGDVLGTNTFVPWRDYATVVLFGLAVAVVRLRPLSILASLGLLLAASAVFFVGW